MGRYLKYLEIVNKIDEAIEKKAAGRVDIDKDLPKIKTMLEVQDLALKMSMCIDRIDDNVKSAFKLYAKGDPSARGVVEEVLEKMKESGGMNGSNAMMNTGGESASGRDFRGGRENPEFERGYSARAGVSQGRADARGEGMNHFHEEDRRGYRGRSEMDSFGEDEETDGHWRGQALFDHMNEEDRRGRSRRTGRFVHRAVAEDYPDTAFWPLTNPWYPFGMHHRPETEEQSRMGFFGNGMHENAPYNNITMPGPLKDLPLVNKQAGQTGQQATAESKASSGNGAAAAATK